MPMMAISFENASVVILIRSLLSASRPQLALKAGHQLGYPILRIAYCVLRIAYCVLRISYSDSYVTIQFRQYRNASFRTHVCAIFAVLPKKSEQLWSFAASILKVLEKSQEARHAFVMKRCARKIPAP